MDDVRLKELLAEADQLLAIDRGTNWTEPTENYREEAKRLLSQIEDEPPPHHIAVVANALRDADENPE